MLGFTALHPTYDLPRVSHWVSSWSAGYVLGPLVMPSMGVACWRALLVLAVLVLRLLRRSASICSSSWLGSFLIPGVPLNKAREVAEYLLRQTLRERGGW
jgi:hypothetical protein